VLRDYVSEHGGWGAELSVEALDQLDADSLLDLRLVAKAIHVGVEGYDPEAGISPRGYRLLSKVPRLGADMIELIVEHFGNLQKIMRVTPAELADVTGIGESRARGIKENLARLAESSILDRYT